MVPGIPSRQPRLTFSSHRRHAPQQESILMKNKTAMELSSAREELEQAAARRSELEAKLASAKAKSVARRALSFPSIPSHQIFTTSS